MIYTISFGYQKKKKRTKTINHNNSVNNTKDLNFHEAIKYLPFFMEKIRITIYLMDIFID